MGGRTMRGVVAAACVVAGLLGGCGGGGDDKEATAKASTTTAPADAAAQAPSEDAEEPPDEVEELEGETVLEEPFDDDSNGWVGDPPEDDPIVPEITNGTLSLAAAEEGSYDSWSDALAVDADEYTDQLVRVTASLTEGGAALVSCRLDPEGEYPKQYSFGLSSAGTYNITKHDGTEEGSEGLATNPSEIKEQRDDDVAPEDLEFEPAFEFSDEDQYEIAVQCVDVDEGVQLAMWVDGDLVLSAVDDDDPLESGVGAVGVVNSSLFADGEFTPYGAAFDDFEFVTPDGAPVGGSGDEDETETETEEETEIEGGTSGEAGSVAVGDQIAADPLATPGALGFPTSGEGLALTYDEGGLFLKLEGEGTAYAFPVASAVQAPTDGVAVGADVVGLAVSIGYEDYWGLTCNVNKETGEFYAFVGQGDIEVDDAYTVSIVRHDEEGFEFLAQETVENGGSRFAMGAACVPTEDGAMHLEMSFGDERVLAHVDEDPLPAGQVGVFLNSESGSSGTSFGNFVVHEASLG